MGSKPSMFVKTNLIGPKLVVEDSTAKTPTSLPPPVIKIEEIVSEPEICIPASDEDLLLLNLIWTQLLRDQKMAIAQETYMKLFIARPGLKRLFHLAHVSEDQLLTHELFLSHLKRFARFLDCTFLFMDRGKEKEKMRGLMSYMNGIGKAHAHIGRHEDSSNEQSQDGVQITSDDTDTLFDEVYWKMFADALLDVVKTFLVEVDLELLENVLNGAPVPVVFGKLGEILGFLIEEMRRGLHQEASVMKHG